MAADGLSALALFIIVASVRFGEQDSEAIFRAVGLAPWLVAVAYGAAWVFVIWAQGLYRLRARWSIRGELTDVLRATVIMAVGTLSILFLLKLPDVSRLFLLLLFLTQPILTLASRLVLRYFFGWIRGRGFNTRQMLIVGTGAEAQAFADRIERHADLGLRVLGHLRAPSESKPRVTRPVLGFVDAIEYVLHEEIVDEVAICLPPSAWSLVEPISRLCEEEGKIVRIPLDVIGSSVAGGQVEEFDGAPILSLLYGPDRVLGLAAKRIIDIIVSGVAVLVLSPVFLAVAIWVHWLDGPPVLFRQTRLGLHGRPFTVLKFRTMVPDAEARLGELEKLNEVRGNAFKVTEDPRLSRSGRWLRRTSIDELPQFWNVLRGEMSIVGPRPPLPREVAGYDIWHRRRLSMKPGITGLWQVGARHESDFDRWVEIDLDYIDRWSLWLDLKIMLRTIPAMLMGQGR
jgi:exopolysaccharide biosynthesis polyprenyl glycosylphosphotransferase